MKKYLLNLTILLVMVMSVFVTSSCSKNDEEVDANSSKLIGTWQEDDMWIDLNDQVGTHYDRFIHFKTDGTAISIDTYEDEVTKGVWTLNGNTLKVTESGGVLIATITELTNTELSFKANGIPMSFKKVSDSKISKYLE